MLHIKFALFIIPTRIQKTNKQKHHHRHPLWLSLFTFFYFSLLSMRVVITSIIAILRDGTEMSLGVIWWGSSHGSKSVGSLLLMIIPLRHLNEMHADALSNTDQYTWSKTLRDGLVAVVITTQVYLLSHSFKPWVEHRVHLVKLST